MATTDSITATHPLYDCRLIQWQRCADCWDGQDAVKAREGGRRYLPPTEGQVLDGAFRGDSNSLGMLNYKAYLQRALFYGFYADAVQMALGLAWTKEPIFEGLEGTPLEYLLTNATNEGESLCRLLYRINEAQLGIGRIGLMADMPAGETNGVPQPYITTYEAGAIRNWDAGRVGDLSRETLNLVVLDECGPLRTGTFEWTEVERYRVLSLGPIDTNDEAGPGIVYKQGVFENYVAKEGNNSKSGTPYFNEEEMYVPTIQGRTLGEIPFVFINATSATSEPVDPPLLSLADLVLSLYMLSADYHQELHASTQATLVTKCAQLPKDKVTNEPIRLGVGSHIDLGSQADADAFFLELEGKGLPGLEKAMEAKIALAQQRAGEIVDQSSRGRESGSAMEQRISVRTANLHAIVQSGATGLERLLKLMGTWCGLTPEQVDAIRVKPNYLFSKPQLDPTMLKILGETKLMGGAALSYEAIHNYLVQRGVTNLSFNEMVQEIDGEKELENKLKPKVDLTQTGGSNGGPAILPASSGL